MDEIYYSCSRCGARYSTPVGKCTSCGINLVPDDATKRFLAAQREARENAERRRVQLEKKWMFFGKSKNTATVFWIVSIVLLARILLNSLRLAVPYLTFIPITNAASAMLVPVIIPVITIVMIPLWDFYLGLFKQAVVKLVITLVLILLPIIVNAVSGPIPVGGAIFAVRFLAVAALIVWNLVDSAYLFGFAKFAAKEERQAV